MKRKPQLVAVLLCVVFFLGAACWYWLSEEDASIDSPAVSPSIEAPPAGNTNVAANPFGNQVGARNDFALARRTIYF
jgi:hypothetical protein